MCEYLTRVFLVAALFCLPSFTTAEAQEKDPDVEIRGTVVDESGQAVSGAIVRHPHWKDEGKTATTDAKGSFVLSLPKQSVSGPMLLAADKTGALQDIYMGKYEADAGMAPPPIRFVLKKAREIPVVVADKDGRPVEQAKVAVHASYKLVAEQSTGRDGKAVLRVPAAAPLGWIYAVKPDVGLDYYLYRQADGTKDNPYSLAPDHAEPLTFSLAGVRPIRVRVMDEGRKPLAGLVVSPWYIELPRKGGDLRTERLSLNTNDEGVAVFNTLPAGNTSKINFWVRSENHYSPERWMLDPASKESEITAELVPLITLRGKATLVGGEPAAGAQVYISGDGHQFDGFHSVVPCGKDGSFEARIYPDQYYVFVALGERMASPAVTRTILGGSKPNPVELTLRPATRVHGKLTIGKDKKPSPRQHLTLYQRDGDNYYKLPKEEQLLPNPKESRKAVIPMIVRGTTTDDQGWFEFFAGPGRYYIMGPDAAKPPEFEITDQKDLEVSIHSDRPDRGEISGRVVLKSDPAKGVSEAKVKGMPLVSRGGHLSAVSSDQGKFRAVRGLSDMLVQAETTDGLLSGIVEITADAKEVTIPVGPTASARGRLIDDKSGEPLADRRIDFGVRITYAEGSFSSVFGGHATTNALGEFALVGLAPGRRYELNLVMEMGPDGFPHAWRTVGSASPEKADVVALGDIRVKFAEGPLSLEERIARHMQAKQPLEERLKTKLRDAKLAEQQVLLLATPQHADACLQFYQLYYPTDRTRKDAEFRQALADFALLPIDTTAGDSAAAARPLLERLKLAMPDKDGALFALLDTDGNLIAAKTHEDLAADGKLSPKRLIDFLSEHAPELPDAEKLLADALARAKREDKRVLVQHSGAFCAPCVLLSRYLDQNAKLLAKDYVYVKLDHRFTNGEEVLKRVRKELGGIPWMVILDASGEQLITSTGPDGNIGFPGEPASVKHFEKMLRSTSRRLNDADIKTLIGGL